jgi:DNA polymerase III epsilon subunit-like protein
LANFYIPFDTETGGLNPDTTDVLTLYMAVMDEEFKILDELDLKLKPDGGRLPIAEAEALAVNKINLQEHMANPATITYSEAKEKIVTMLKKYLKKNGRYSNLIPLGHNVPFDVGYTQKYILPKDEWEKILHYAYFDTSPIVTFLKRCGWFPRELGNLGSVVDFMNVPKRAAHNAKEDTLMCADVAKAMIAMMISKKNSSSSGSQQQDLISLLEAE